MAGRIVILGAAESGVGAAILARKKGFDVFVSDAGTIKESYKQMLVSHQIPYEEKQHTLSKILEADTIIKSPGIPEKAEMMKVIRQHSLPVISEIEFASRYTQAKLIAITGSNGKTTTTSLIYHMLKKAGLPAALGGNIGKSFALLVAEETNYEYYVLEISNFQLDDIVSFKPSIAILLNITPDHLDRYNYEFERYVNAKFRITENLTEQDYFIYCLDDPETMKTLRKRNIKAKMLPFSTRQVVSKGAYVKNNILNIQYDNMDFSMSLEELALKGQHNVYNSMAAALTGSLLQLSKETIRESLMEFKGVEHRLEHVTTINEVEYINDSKATNVNSTWYALECMTKPVIWIAGGTDKGNDYSQLTELVKQKVKALICLTADSSKLHKAFDGIVPVIVDCRSMAETVAVANKLSAPGDVVLLSPACASFDLFENYEDRGNQFKKYVKEL